MVGDGFYRVLEQSLAGALDFGALIGLEPIWRHGRDEVAHGRSKRASLASFASMTPSWRLPIFPRIFTTRSSGRGPGVGSPHFRASTAEAECRLWSCPASRRKPITVRPPAALSAAVSVPSSAPSGARAVLVSHPISQLAVVVHRQRRASGTVLEAVAVEPSENVAVRVSVLPGRNSPPR